MYLQRLMFRSQAVIKPERSEVLLVSTFALPQRLRTIGVASVEDTKAVMVRWPKLRTNRFGVEPVRLNSMHCVVGPTSDPKFTLLPVTEWFDFKPNSSQLW